MKQKNKEEAKQPDQIDAVLPQGGSLWPRLNRMAEVSSGMQQLEWALARRAGKGKKEDAPEPYKKRNPKRTD